MGIFSKSISSGNTGGQAEVNAPVMRQGRLTHVFVFESGPHLDEPAQHIKAITRALVPEILAYDDVPTTYFHDEHMPPQIGENASANFERALDYSLAWSRIWASRSDLVEGLKAGCQRYTFGSSEFSHISGSRGIVYAFYKLAIEPCKQRGQMRSNQG